jgi:hypothetical protein
MHTCFDVCFGRHRLTQGRLNAIIPAAFYPPFYCLHALSFVAPEGSLLSTASGPICSFTRPGSEHYRTLPNTSFLTELSTPNWGSEAYINNVRNDRSKNFAKCSKLGFSASSFHSEASVPGKRIEPGFRVWANWEESAVGREEDFGGFGVLGLQVGADLIDCDCATGGKVAKGSVPDESRGFAVGGVDVGKSRDVGQMRKNIRAWVVTILSFDQLGRSVNGKVGHAFLQGVEIVATWCMRGSKDFADAVFIVAGEAKDRLVENAGLAIGLLDAAERANFETGEVTEGGIAADEKSREDGCKKKRAKEKGAINDESPGFSEHCM